MSRNRTWVFLGISMLFRFCKYRDDAIAWSLNLNHGVFCLELKPMTFIKHAYQLDPVFFGTLCSRLWVMWEWMLAAKRLGCGALWTFEFVGPLACLVVHANINASNRCAWQFFTHVSTLLGLISTWQDCPNHSRWVGNFKANSAFKFEQDQPRLSGSHLC